MSTAIELRGVEKNFGITSVIRNVNLTVAQGERHALIGPNGAGKSTLFNLISGYMMPTVGSILLRDEVISNDTGSCLAETPNGSSSWPSTIALGLAPIVFIRSTLAGPLKLGSSLDNGDAPNLSRGCD